MSGLRVQPLLLLSLVVAVSACPSDDAPADADTSGSATSMSDTTAGTSMGTDAVDTSGGSDVSGEELYGQLCSPCHGASGEGTALGYELQHPVRELSVWVVRNGRPGDEFEGSSMASYSPQIASDAQLDEIWDYLDSFPQPTTGEGLYLDYCRNCHGTDALGGVVAKDISDKGFADALERIRDGAGLGDVGARMLYMPAFGADVISDAEVQLVVDYIATL